MLQVARLAPKQLGESRDLVAGFLREQLNPDGGFQDRAGASDLYYTVFGLDALDRAAGRAARRRRPPRTSTDSATAPGSTSSTSPAWRAAGRRCAVCPTPRVVDRLLARIEACRSADGGYATTPGAPHGSAYGAFLALGAYQDLGRDAAGRRRRARRRCDGCAPPTAATAIIPACRRAHDRRPRRPCSCMRHLDAPPDRDAGMWLLDRCHARGGFFASRATPVPDLLSTATALHALSALHVPIAGLREPCLDFVDSLWTNRGGFFGTWADDAVDCEYTYYALLALGHLSLEPS